MRASLLFFVLLLFSACESPYMIKHPAAPGDVYYLNATFYGDAFNGKKAADGSIFNENEMTCAARGFPFGTYLAVRSVDTGKSVVVKVTDRPGKNVIDLSKKSFSIIDDLAKGKIRVKVKVVTKPKVIVKETEFPNKRKAAFFTIEAGSFNDLDKAKELQKALGVESYIFAVNNSVFKVRIGRFATKAEAQKAQKEKLKDKKAQIVKVNE